MNYRGRQVKLMWERDIARREQNWTQERQQFQQDILNLQNSTEAKVIEQLEQDLQKQKDLLNQTIDLLGKKEIKTLSDLANLLGGQTLKGLIDQKERTIMGLNRSYEKLAQKQQEQAKELTQQLEQTNERLKFSQDNLKTQEGIIEDYKKDLAQAKISELENQLLNLAKQKLTKQKQAKELLTQIETQWKEKQTQWEAEKAQLEEEKARQQDFYAQTLAQTKQEHAEELRSLKTRHQQTLQQEKAVQEEKLQEAKQVYDNYRHQKEQELNQKQTKINELQEWSAGQHERILELENNLNLAETEKAALEQEKQGILTRASESIREKEGVITNLQNQVQASQQDNQTKQTLIDTLNEDKVGLQARITELTQTLTRQRTVLEQLQTNREEELRELERGSQ